MKPFWTLALLAALASCAPPPAAAPRAASPAPSGDLCGTPRLVANPLFGSVLTHAGDTLLAHFNYVPDFAKEPTKVSAKSGNWSDPGTWVGGAPVVNTELVDQLKAARASMEGQKPEALALVDQAIAIVEQGTGGGGGIPEATDVVQIAPGHTVTIDATAEADAIGVAGTLAFDASRDTKLTVANLLVYPAGAVASSPITAGRTAKIVIRDQPVLAAATTSTDAGSATVRPDDPDQFGTGIQVFGALKLNGATKTNAVRAAGDILAGAATLTLKSQPSGWQPGDELELPDTRMLGLGKLSLYATTAASPHDQRERVRIRSVSGSTVTLETPTKYAHLAGRNASDNAIRFTMPVLNLTRNFVIESENPQGTRGHVIAFDHADVRLKNVRVLDMGRTRYVASPVGDRYEEHKQSLNSTKMAVTVQTGGFGGLPATVTMHRSGDGLTIQGSNPNGVTAALAHGTITLKRGTNTLKAAGGRVFAASEYSLVSAGTNQVGRYPLHLHHVSGPDNPTNTGYQFEVTNCVVDGTIPTKWGVALHHTSYGLLQSTIVLGTQHWAVTTEDGSEYENEIRGNYAASHSNHAAFYSNGPLNRFVGNVACNSFGGFLINGGSPDKTVTVPTVRGGHTPDKEQAIKMMDATLLDFTGNEAFATSLAFQAYDFATLGSYGGGDVAGRKVVKVDGFKAWANLRVTTLYDNLAGAGMDQYTPPVVLTGLVALGDIAQARYTDTNGEHVGIWWGGGSEFILRDSEIQGFAAGILDRARQGNQVAAPFRAQIENSRFANRNDYHQNGSWNADEHGKQVVFLSPEFLPAVNASGTPITGRAYIRTDGMVMGGFPLAPNRIYVKGLAGKNLRVFAPNQAPAFVIPKVEGSRIPAEWVGKTNAQMFAATGKSIGGEMAPAAAISNFSNIVGLVETLPAFPDVVIP